MQSWYAHLLSVRHGHRFLVIAARVLIQSHAMRLVLSVALPIQPAAGIIVLDVQTKMRVWVLGAAGMAAVPCPIHQHVLEAHVNHVAQKKLATRILVAPGITRLVALELVPHALGTRVNCVLQKWHVKQTAHAVGIQALAAHQPDQHVPETSANNVRQKLPVPQTAVVAGIKQRVALLPEHVEKTTVACASLPRTAPNTAFPVPGLRTLVRSQLLLTRRSTAP